MLRRPHSCLTMFCDHNFSLVCRFNLQFSQNYINIDTDGIQHWFCYFVHCEIKTLYMSGRTVAHFTVFSSLIQILFSSCSILFCIQLCKAHTTRVHMDVGETGTPCRGGSRGGGRPGPCPPPFHSPTFFERDLLWPIRSDVGPYIDFQRSCLNFMQ